MSRPMQEKNVKNRARFMHGVFAVLLWAVFCGNASAASHYIRSGSSGANNGTNWSDAWQQLPASLIRGDTYYVADGNYGGYVFDDANSGSQVITIKKATAADHGTDTGWQGSFGDGTAVFTGTIDVRNSYFVFDGSNGGGPGSWKTGHGFEFTSPAGTSINYFQLAEAVSNVTLRHIYFNQTGNTEVYTTGAAAIYNSTTVFNSLFEYLYFENLGALPFMFRGGGGNIMQYNYTGDICGMSVADFNQHCEAVVIHDMDDSHFRWNYVAECPSSGGFVKNNTQNSNLIRIYGNVFENGFPINCNSGSCTNWRVFNNTFHSFGGGPVGGDGAADGTNLFYNNIIYGASYLGYLWGTHDYNWFSNSAGARCTMSPNSHENICVDCAAGCDSVTEVHNPFLNAAGNTTESFRLAAPIDGHPGVNICLLDDCQGEDKYNIDTFGNIRGADGSWDRGALEYAAGPADTTPPAAPTGLTAR